MSDLSPALVRTAIPIVVGPLVARYFPGVDVQDPDMLLLLSAVISYLYYVLVRLLETKAPQLGYLLGVAKAPAYSRESAPSPGPDEHLDVEVVPDEPGHVDEADTPSATRVTPSAASINEGSLQRGLRRTRRSKKQA